MKKNTMTTTAYGAIKDFAVSCRFIMDYATRRHLADVAEEARIYDGGYHSSPSINRLLADIRMACIDSGKFPPADLILRANAAASAYEMELTRNDKREKCAAAGRAVRQLQADYRAEVMEEMLAALEGFMQWENTPRHVRGDFTIVKEKMRVAIMRARRNLGK